MRTLNRTVISSGVNIPSCSSRKWARADDDGGQSLIEFALAAPAMLLVLLGIFTFGIVINNYLTLTEAVNVGGRALAISRSSALDPCATTVAAVQAAAPNLNAATMSFTFKIYTAAAASTTYPGTSCSSANYTTGAAGNMTQGQAAQVTVTYPCSLSVYGINYGPSTCNLTAQTTELVQ
jgi:Flp pilus assembly protein TadG